MILHRHLLKELLANLGVTIVALLTVFFLGALSVQIGKASMESLPMTTVLHNVGLLVVATSNLTLPLAVLTTCIFTYGRATADGEINAAQTSGISVWQALVPALLVGALAMLAVAALEDRLTGETKFQARSLGDTVIRDIEHVLEGADHRIDDSGFAARWHHHTRDKDGALILHDFFLVEFKDGLPARKTSAREAVPKVDATGRSLRIGLRDFHRTGDGTRAAGLIEVTLDLDALASPAASHRSGSERSYEELVTLASRDLEGGVPTRALTEYHLRLALAASALLFAFLGAPLGMRLRVHNRALVFLVGLLVVVVGYWPFVILAQRMCNSGAWNPVIAMHLPNAVLLVAGVTLHQRVARP